MSAPLPLEEAQARILALAKPLAIERVDVASALGRFTSEPLIARRCQPAADASAMDGYAVRGPDLAGPWAVIGESAAGHSFDGTVGAGEAVRISTGAKLPDGADTVIVQEDVAREGSALRLTGTPPSPAGKHIRRRASDFGDTAELLAVGAHLGPAQLALALSAGHSHIAVRRMPRLTVIDSGDELAADPENCPAHQTPASNGAMLAAMASALPCTVRRDGPVADDIAALVAAFERAAGADLIVTSGGASVGDHDLIRPALEAWRAKIDFWRIAIKPGKPLLVARKADTIVLGLPGNPVSSYVTAFHFMLPLLRALAGSTAPIVRPVMLPLAAPMAAGGERREFLRGRLTAGGIEPLLRQDSGALAALSQAQVLIDRAAKAPAHGAGEQVPVYLL